MTLSQIAVSGTYSVGIIVPVGYASSTDIPSSANPNNNTNSDDNGVLVLGNEVQSNPIDLTPGSSGALNNTLVDATTGTTSNPTLDFGIALIPTPTPTPNQNGAPVRLVVPWKYGFKSAKSIVRIRFVERQPLTTWERSVPGEYGFYSNVNPRRRPSGPLAPSCTAAPGRVRSARRASIGLGRGGQVGAWQISRHGGRKGAI